jgi:hypothetical protein
VKGEDVSVLVHRSRIVAAGLALLVLGACGGTAAPPAGGTGTPTSAATADVTPDAGTPAGGETVAPGGPAGAIGERICSLVPVEVVATAMGEEVTDTYNANESACDWDLESASSIQFRHEGGPEAVQTMRETFPGGQDVAGIGDEAYHQGSLLTFSTGDAAYTIQLVLMGGEMTDAEKLAVLQPIALAAIAAGL